jgi:large subunit ribosomal protein L15
MTFRQRKKSRHVRGKHWTGTRSKRGAGNRGGRGRAGLGKRAAHRKDMFIHSERYLGKHGFHSVKQRKNFHPVAINVDQLDKLAESLVHRKLAEKKTEGIEIHLKKLGYGKLIGKGFVKNKLIVHVPASTQSAKQKIESAGGKIIEE